MRREALEIRSWDKKTGSKMITIAITLTITITSEL